MSYFLTSVQTLSYWKYALFSVGGLTRVLCIVGAIYLFIEMLDFFGVYSRDRYGQYAIFIVFGLSVIGAVVSRRPVRRISYKIPKRDFSYEVVVGDILDTKCDNVVISTNTTFDTDIASGLIAPDSLQGQLALRYFGNKTSEMDRQIEISLRNQQFENHPSGCGAKKRYPVGTVANIQSHNKTFFLTAMSELNEHGTAHSDVSMIDTSLEALWKYIVDKGELSDIAIPILGTGRGRIQLTRKKMIERIAQSFADESSNHIFSNRLTIYIHPDDACKHQVNLFEVRDYLSLSLHV